MSGTTFYPFIAVIPKQIAVIKDKGVITSFSFMLLDNKFIIVLSIK